jgi:hypothetical protein
MGPNGSLYGGTARYGRSCPKRCGVIFELAPPATAGGADGGYGTIFKLVPPAAAGAPWTEVILYSFTGTADSAFPGPIAFGPDGNLYGITDASGTRYILDYGTAFQFVLQ